MAKYKLIAKAGTPQQWDSEDYASKFKMMQKSDYFAIEELGRQPQYRVENGDIEEFDENSTYILDEDGNGIYLYKKMGN
jgi:hypothetical protein